MIVGLAVEQKNAGLGGYGDLYLVDNLQAATTFETFLSDKDKDVTQELCLVRRRQQPVQRHVSFDDLQPIIRKLPTGKSISSPLLESEHILTTRP